MVNGWPSYWAKHFGDIEAYSGLQEALRYRQFEFGELMLPDMLEGMPEDTLLQLGMARSYSLKARFYQLWYERVALEHYDSLYEYKVIINEKQPEIQLSPYFNFFGALAKIEKGEYDLARPILQALRAEKRLDGEILALIGTYLAVLDIQQSGAVNYKPATLLAKAEWARWLIKLGKTDMAQPWIDELKNLVPAGAGSTLDNLAIYDLAECLLATGDLNSALEVFDRTGVGETYFEVSIGSINNQDFIMRFVFPHALRVVSHCFYAKAELQYDQLVANAPGAEIAAQFFKGECLLQRGNYDDAEINLAGFVTALDATAPLNEFLRLGSLFTSCFSPLQFKIQALLNLCESRWAAGKQPEPAWLDDLKKSQEACADPLSLSKMKVLDARYGASLASSANAAQILTDADLTATAMNKKETYFEPDNYYTVATVNLGIADAYTKNLTNARDLLKKYMEGFKMWMPSRINSPEMIFYLASIEKQYDKSAMEDMYIKNRDEFRLQIGNAGGDDLYSHRWADVFEHFYTLSQVEHLLFMQVSSLKSGGQASSNVSGDTSQ